MKYFYCILIGILFAVIQNASNMLPSVILSYIWGFVLIILIATIFRTRLFNNWKAVMAFLLSQTLINLTGPIRLDNLIDLASWVLFFLLIIYLRRSVLRNSIIAMALVIGVLASFIYVKHAHEKNQLIGKKIEFPKTFKQLYSGTKVIYAWSERCGWCKHLEKDVVTPLYQTAKQNDNTHVIYAYVPPRPIAQDSTLPKLIFADKQDKPVYIDLDMQLKRELEINSYPQLYVVDQNNVVQFHSGGYNWDLCWYYRWWIPKKFM